MKLFGVDLETGGSFTAPIEENFITEIGGVLWDTDHGAPVVIFSQLVNLGKKISDEAAEYTGITNEIIQEYGESPSDGIFRFRVQELYDLMESADYIVAHNGTKFDKPLLKAFFSNLGMEMPDKIWIDTRVDVPYPSNCVARNLTYLAGFHLILNSFPHRAVTDVLTMLTILCKYDLDEVIAIAKSPTLYVEAITTYDEREKPKAAKFQWNPETKKWVKEIKQCFYEQESSKWDFKFTTKELPNEEKN